jgi:chromosome segregation ATPase
MLSVLAKALHLQKEMWSMSMTTAETLLTTLRAEVAALRAERDTLKARFDTVRSDIADEFRVDAAALRTQLDAERLHWRQIHEGCHAERDALSLQLEDIKKERNDVQNAHKFCRFASPGDPTGARRGIVERVLRERTAERDRIAAEGMGRIYELEAQLADEKRYAERLGRNCDYAYGRLNEIGRVLDPSVTPSVNLSPDAVLQWARELEAQLAETKEQIAQEWRQISTEIENANAGYEQLAAVEAQLAETKKAYGKLFMKEAALTGELEGARAQLAQRTAALTLAFEWAAAYPRQGEGSPADWEAATRVYEEARRALGEPPA